MSVFKHLKKDKNKISFLIADSKKLKRLSIIKILKDLGFEHFDEVPDGGEAYRILKHQSIDCILSANDMPDMTGLSLLKVVSEDETLFKIPFLLLAPTVDRDMVLSAGKCGVAAIILEPITFEVLEEKMNVFTGAPTDESEVKIEELFEKAEQLKQTGDLDKALTVYSEALKVEEDAEVYFNIGYIKTGQKKYDEALVAFRKAVMINDLHAHAFKMMGEVYKQKGDTREAEHYFSKAGDIFMERHLDKEAEDAFNEVIKINPDTVNIYNSLGIIYRKRSNYSKAISQYLKAKKIDPEDENILYNLGRAFLDNKDISKAKETFEEALLLNPDFNEAKRMIHAIEVGFK